MGDPKILRTEVDGREATAEQLRFPAFTYGHFTAMQIRGRKVRGLELHLSRLDAANRELFGAGLDGDLVRDQIRHALGDDMADASVRVYVGEHGRGRRLDHGHRARSDRRDGRADRHHVRPVPAVRAAHQAPGGPRAGLPSAPRRAGRLRRCAPDGSGRRHLRMRDREHRVLRRDVRRLARCACPARHHDAAGGAAPPGRRRRRHAAAPVHVHDLGSYRAAFVTNSRGIVPVATDRRRLHGRRRGPDAHGGSRCTDRSHGTPSEHDYTPRR